ncbi:hypothetical protein [Novosphingobium sp. SG707]|uniref:hypothetical protein n=1 Tax=Novosphingobium sp. SG707 TaxID=2586996 RepID=UPI001B2FE7F9|nr:hypothetical protein [Novosphingobium sp. SG707]
MLISSNAALAQGDLAKTITLAPNAEVVVTPNDTLSSKSLKVGDKFKISTVFDVMQEGYVLIPRGTPGEASVSYRTGKGAFGKSAKLEVTFNSLKLGDRVIPLNGTYRSEGQGNAGAAVGAVVAVGVFGAFVTGHSATLTNGQQLRAHTADPVSFTIPVGTAPLQAAALAPAAPVAKVENAGAAATVN